MTPEALEELIRSRIPVADFMQLTVALVTPDEVVIGAPLEPNRNVHGTLFGGSGTAIGLVAAWSLVHVRMQDEGLKAPLVVAQQTTHYFKPVTGAVTARAAFDVAQAWAPFAQRVNQGQRARVQVVVELRQEGPGNRVGDAADAQPAARIEALFAALPT